MSCGDGNRLRTEQFTTNKGQRYCLKHRGIKDMESYMMRQANSAPYRKQIGGAQ